MESRERFRQWTGCLLDPTRTPLDHRQAADEWCTWALERLCVEENEPGASTDGFRKQTLLASGKAISPLDAARCVRDYRRTAVFLQAMDAALQAARDRFPGEQIHVLEAGCGPLAPLSLPFALLYSPEEVTFTLLDVHASALEAAQHLADELNVRASIRTLAATDATTVKFPVDERPHVIVCELLWSALSREPQVAATLNLAPQLRPGGVFLPERVDVHAALFDSAKHYRRLRGENIAAFTELGQVFSLDAYCLDRLQRREHCLSAAAITVPPHDARTPLHLCTRIQVFRSHCLGDFDSSPNLPRRVKHSIELAAAGGVAEFFYEISSEPGLRLSNHQ